MVCTWGKEVWFVSAFLWSSPMVNKARRMRIHTKKRPSHFLLPPMRPWSLQHHNMWPPFFTSEARNNIHAILHRPYQIWRMLVLGSHHKVEDIHFHSKHFLIILQFQPSPWLRGILRPSSFACNTTQKSEHERAWFSLWFASKWSVVSGQLLLCACAMCIRKSERHVELIFSAPAGPFHYVHWLNNCFADIFIYTTLFVCVLTVSGRKVFTGRAK